VAGFGLVLGWLIWLEWARGALSNGGIFKKIGAVLSFRFWLIVPLTSSRYLYETCFSYACSVLCEQDYEGSSSGFKYY
jgi:hypothetical protein